MLSDTNVVATLAVSDIEAARRFYEGTLGLQRAERQSSDPSAVLYRSGGSTVLVYQSQFAGTNQATAASWGVGDDLEAVVEELRSKGVSFEHYDMPGVSLDGDVHLIGDIKAAWFKDPDGNILNLVNKSM